MSNEVLDAENKRVKCSVCGKDVHIDELGAITKHGIIHSQCVEIGVKVKRLFSEIQGFPFNVEDEKRVQEQMSDLLSPFFKISKEHRLSNSDIIDFLLDDTIGVEVKVKGSVEQIFKQCERYCEHDTIKAFVLVTARSMGFPKEINGVPCYYYSLSRNLL